MIEPIQTTIPKVRRVYGESSMQQALIRWWKLAHRGLGVPDHRLLFAIPNGGLRRSTISAGILVAEGVRSGIPDLFLAVGTENANGLFIEMKTPHGATSVFQQEMLAALAKQNYTTVVARSFDEARQAIETHLRGSPHHG